MNSKSVILIGLLASILLIFLCIHFNAERYYKELGLEKLNTNTKIKTTSSIVIKSNEEENVSTIEEFDKESIKEEPLTVEVEDIVQEEELIEEEVETKEVKVEETSSFFYRTENKQKFVSGALPLLEDGDEFKKFISECIETNFCENSVTFLDNGETLSWKTLVLSVIGLFDKVEVENSKISVEKKGIKLEGMFESQEAKNHLSSLLVEYKLPYKVYDMTTIAVKEKPRFTIIKDENKKEEEIKEAQKEISQLLKEKKIHFEKNSEEITLEGKKVLDELFLTLKDPDNTLLEVQGHTDAGGKKKVNLMLSQSRASAVKKYLIQKGLKTENITAKGFGESKLLLPQTPYSILNRRVEIYLKRK